MRWGEESLEEGALEQVAQSLVNSKKVFRNIPSEGPEQWGMSPPAHMCP